MPLGGQRAEVDGPPRLAGQRIVTRDARRFQTVAPVPHQAVGDEQVGWIDGSEPARAGQRPKCLSVRGRERDELLPVEAQDHVAVDDQRRRGTPDRTARAACRGGPLLAAGGGVEAYGHGFVVIEHVASIGGRRQRKDRRRLGPP